MDANGEAPASAMTYELIKPFKLNNHILAAGTVALLVVVFLVLCIHVYAKVFWRTPFLPSHAPSSHRPSAFPTQGLAKATIASLPTFYYNAPPSQKQAPLECAVCLLEFSENEEGRLLPSCGHSFHTHCIDMWFHSHTTCPLCRTVVAVSAEEITPKSVKASNFMHNLPSPVQLLRCWSAPHTCSVTNGTLLPLNCGSFNDLLVLGDHSHASCQSGHERNETEASPSTICSSLKIPAEAACCATTRRCFSKCPPEDAHEALVLAIIEQSHTQNEEVLEKKREPVEDSSVPKEHTEHDEEAAVTYFITPIEIQRQGA